MSMYKSLRNDRLHYHFDNMMSKGTIALIGWLGIASLVLIILFALFVKILGVDTEQRGVLELIWIGFMHTLDTGAVAGDSYSGGPLLLSLLLAVTMVGIFIMSSLIGVLTTGFQDKLAELKKGRSFVAEERHTVILGWSSQIFTLIDELVKANANQSRACIAILAEKDMVEMQDEIRARLPDAQRTRIVCRTGTPHDIAELGRINPNGARAIVILSPEDAQPDIYVLKTLLALIGQPNRSSNPYHIVTSIQDEKNLEVARLIAGDQVEVILTSDLLARITAQTCRQAGLSVAYNELLDFGGDEIYFYEERSLLGKTFGEALTAYDDSTVIGVRTPDGHKLLNPSPQLPLEYGTKLIVIAADDDTIHPHHLKQIPIDESLIATEMPQPPMPEHTLILGWNRRAIRLLSQLVAYTPLGSHIQIVAADQEIATNALCEWKQQSNQLLQKREICVEFQAGDITSRCVLDRLGLGSYQHVIVLSETGERETGERETGGQIRDNLSDPQQVDAHTLITLLHLRDIANKQATPFSIVSEMLDIRNRELAQVARADDFVISDKLVSLMLSQIAENKELAPVFQDLFDPEGVEMYFKPASAYVQLDRPVTFYTIVESALRRGETAIGYRLQANAYDASQAYGVKLNPRKSDAIHFGQEDRVIVLAEM